MDFSARALGSSGCAGDEQPVIDGHRDVSGSAPGLHPSQPRQTPTMASTVETEDSMTALIDDPSRDSANPFIVWGNALLADPLAAVSDILSGRGARGAHQRAEPEDFLADLLAHPTWRDDRTQLTEGLDTALLNWLKAWSEWSPACISRFGGTGLCDSGFGRLEGRGTAAVEGYRERSHLQSSHMGRPISRVTLARRYRPAAAIQSAARAAPDRRTLCFALVCRVRRGRLGQSFLAIQPQHWSDWAAQASSHGRYRTGDEGGCGVGQVRGAGPETRYESAPG